MTTARELGWRDVEAAEDSGVFASPQHQAFPLVHRIEREHEVDVYVDPEEVELIHRAHADEASTQGFFSTAPIYAPPRDDFDDLDDEAELAWQSRRGRRAFVKAVAAVSFVGVVVLAVFAGTNHAGARSAVTEWATLGAMR